MKLAITIFACFCSLLALAASNVETAPPDSFQPALLVVVLMFFALCLILIGIGIVVALAGLFLMGILVAMGIVSTTTLVALARRRFSDGLRAFHYQIFAVIFAPCGVVGLWISHELLHFELRQRYILLLGIGGGILAGITTAYILDRLACYLCSRFLQTNRLCVVSEQKV